MTCLIVFVISKSIQVNVGQVHVAHISRYFFLSNVIWLAFLHDILSWFSYCRIVSLSICGGVGLNINNYIFLCLEIELIGCYLFSWHNACVWAVNFLVIKVMRLCYLTYHTGPLSPRLNFCMLCCYHWSTLLLLWWHLLHVNHT